MLYGFELCYVALQLNYVLWFWNFRNYIMWFYELHYVVLQLRYVVLK